ncbi:MAG: hypothetical protein AAFY69_10465 [Pseudomonadota bacterium]
MNTPKPWLTLIEATGEDREDFLQGQLTQDLRSVDTTFPVRLAASCDAKGRVLAVLTLIRHGDRLLLALRSDQADAWLAHVLRFRLRARVELAPCEDLKIVASAAGNAWTPLADAALEHPPSGEPSWRIDGITERLAPADEAAETLDASAWRAARIAANIADVGPAAAGDFTPHMLGLDRVGAISFSKGCYTGQEVVARTEHLGAVKRRAQRIRVSAGVLDEGAALLSGDRSAGRIVVASGDSGLAVLPVADDGNPLALEDGRAVKRDD